MALTIDHVCDLSGKREAAKLPKSGPLDLGKIPLPDGWVRRPKFDGVGPQDDAELTLCPEAIEIYEKALLDGEEAKKQVYKNAFNSARSMFRKAQPVAAGTHRSSSFAQPQY
jgi:hypothetical protein